MDKQDLLVRRKQAEDKFELLKKSVEAITNELRQHGVETIEAANEELLRLQGEHRLLTEQIDAAPEPSNTSGKVINKSKVSPKANVINVDEGKKDE